MHGTCMGAVISAAALREQRLSCRGSARVSATGLAEGSVPPPGGSGGLGWAPTDTGTSPKLGVMEVGGVTRSEGESNKNAVMFARSLGLQKSLNNNWFPSLHAGGVWWGYSFLQGFNPSAPGVTSGKLLGQLDRSSKTL